jgi:hypothetical protein
MTSGAKTAFWVVAGVLLVALIFFSRTDQGMKDGDKGSYLGRMASDTALPANQAQALAGRTATQRY